MKEVLSVFTFGIGALCFVVFVTVFKPTAASAVHGPSKPRYLTSTVRHGPHQFRTRNDHSTVQRTQSTSSLLKNAKNEAFFLFSGPLLGCRVWEFKTWLARQQPVWGYGSGYRRSD